MKKLFTILTNAAVLLLLNSTNTLAQNINCGAIVNDIPSVNSYTLPEEDYVLNRSISVTAHILHQESGSPVIGDDTVRAQIASCNRFFEEMKLSFELCSINHIYNYNYSKLSFNKPYIRKELKTKHFQPNTLNIYFVDSIFDETENPICGFAEFPEAAPSPESEKHIIAITALCSINQHKVIAHEIGHYFGLYHTFETQFGSESPDGSNCAIAGDQLCDTPADQQGATNDDCEVISANGGIEFTPLSNNIMSYYDAKCFRRFTIGQYKRMTKIYYSHRSFLY